MHWNAGGNGYLIDSHTLFRVEEQPIPVERHHLEIKGPLARRDRPAWIEVVGPVVDRTAEEEDGERRDRPDDQLDPAGIAGFRGRSALCGSRRGTSSQRSAMRPMSG